MSDEITPSPAQTPEAKLAALREIIDAAIKRGGSHTDAEVRTAIKARLTQLPATIRMHLSPKIVLQLPVSNPDALGPFVENCLRDGVALIALVGENAAAVEDLIDNFVVGEGSDRNRFIATSAHEGETLEEVMEFAATFNVNDGGSVQLVRL